MDWHASVYGSRTGGSGGFGVDPTEYSFSGFDEGYEYDDTSYEDDNETGSTFGAAGHHPVSDTTLKASAGNAFYRAQEIIDSGRMNSLNCESEGKALQLSCSVDSAGLDGEYAVWAKIDETRGEIVDSSCTCPAYGRYGKTCKHVVALIMRYNRRPQDFDPQNPVGARNGSELSLQAGRRVRKRTSYTLQQFMAAQSSAQQEQAKNRQLELLKAVGSKASGEGMAGAQASLTVTPGSVVLRPLLEDFRSGRWGLRLHITVPRRNISYVVKDIYNLVDAVKNGRFFSYGKKLAFVHTRDAFDERSRELLHLVERAVEIRSSITLGYDYYRTKSDNAHVELSDDEAAELLNLYVDQDATFDFAASGGWHTAATPMHVVDGDPDLGIEIVPSDVRDEAGRRTGVSGSYGASGVRNRQAASPSGGQGYVIRHRLSVDRFIVGSVASFVIVHPSGESALHGTQGQAVHRCSQSMVAEREVLTVLCSPSGSVEGSELYLESRDVEEFARTVLPQLVPVQRKQTDMNGLAAQSEIEGQTSSHQADHDALVSASADSGTGVQAHGAAVVVPDELLALRQTPCEIETYLDRDEYGVTCDIQARYGEERFHVFLGIGPNEPLTRDKDTERLAVEAARHYFPAPDGIFARIRESDDDAIYKLLNEGLPVLRSIGQVFCTPAFDGLRTVSHPVLKLGLSVRSGLVEISPIADEIDPAEVPALLKSYHKRRRFHRLSNGAFVDLSQMDASKLDEVSADLGLKPGELSAGPVAVPAYEAYYLDAQADEDDKSDEFRSYLNGMKTVDAARYQVPESLKSVLRPYQQEGFRWLNAAWDKGFGGILADEMGLGKTVQTLAFLLSRVDEQRGIGPNIIVCPASLVYNWAAECEKFASGLNVAVMAGTKSERRGVLQRVEAAQKASGKDSGNVADAGGSSDGGDTKLRADVPDVLITSYDLLRRDLEDYRSLRFSCMVLDEAQYIKNHATKASQAVRSLNAQHRFALTGTPIENRLSELWSIFDFLMPGMLGSYKHFRERFEMPIMSGDAIVQKKLQAFVGPFILRRLKSQVLKDLPDKIENVITVRLEGEQRKLYAALEQQLRATLNKQRDIEFKTGKIQILAQLTRLRQACCDPRLLFDNVGVNEVKHESRAWGAPARDTAVDEVEAGAALDAEATAAATAGSDVKRARAVPSAKLDAIEELVSSCQDAGQKMLIFSQFTSFLDLVAQRLRREHVEYYTITGATAKRKRLELVDQFNADSTPVFLISLKAGNTGLNLTGASVVVHADPWWNAAAQDQATDRAHRIGQKNDVNVYQVVAKDTIEERILEMQRTKTDLASRFVDEASSNSSGGMAKLSKDDLLALLG